AMNSNRQLYSTPAIEDTLRTVRSGNAAVEICETVIKSVDAFVKEAPQSDDITILIIRYCGPDGVLLEETPQEAHEAHVPCVPLVVPALLMESANQNSLA